MSNQNEESLAVDLSVPLITVSVGHAADEAKECDLAVIFERNVFVNQVEECVQRNASFLSAIHFIRCVPAD